MIDRGHIRHSQDHRMRTGAAVFFAVALMAGCSSSSSESTAPATTAPPAGDTQRFEVSTKEWDLGSIKLSDGAVTQFQGVISAPTDGGAHPLAIVLHGSHPVCRDDPRDYGSWPCPAGTEIANYDGLRYLVEAMAKRGFVAVSPNINVQYTLGSGEPDTAARTSEIAQKTFDSVVAGKLGVPTGWVDGSKLVIVGHSVGGQDATLLAGGQTSFTEPVTGVILLQPAVNDTRALPLVDIPAVVVVSECDGDTRVVGGEFLSDAMNRIRTAPVALVGLEHANHNGTNSELRPDGFSIVSPGCGDQKLSAEQQQTLLAGIVPELAIAVSGRVGDGWAGHVFDEPAPPAGIQLAVIPGGSHPAPIPGSNPNVLDSLALDGFTGTFCPAGYYTPYSKPGTEACHRAALTSLVGNPKSLALSWDSPGASLTVPLAASAGEVLRLRAYADIADQRLGAGPVRLRLSDGRGWTDEFVITVPDHTIEPGADLDLSFDLAHGFLLWQTHTVKLPADVAELTIEVTAPTAGTIHLVSVGVDGR